MGVMGIRDSGEFRFQQHSIDEHMPPGQSARQMHGISGALQSRQKFHGSASTAACSGVMAFLS